MADQIPQRPLVPDLATELAIVRTRAAFERTMMAWIRTAVSLITFGFTIYKFFQLEALAVTLRSRLIGHREFALILEGIGLLSLLLATIEYRWNLRSLAWQGGQNRRSLAVIVAALVSIAGVLALVAMILRE